MKRNRIATLLSSVPAVLLLTGSAIAQETITQAPGANIEPPSALVGAGDGFVITLGGGTDTAPNATSRAIRADRALDAADLSVTYDGLTTERRLTLLVLDAPSESGGTLRVESQMNYPAFVDRGEVRIVDFGARGGPKVIATAPIAPNGTAALALPEGDTADLAIVHRVYDARGRYDETAPSPLAADETTEIGGEIVEEGRTRLASARIPLFGGAVTVRGSGLAPRATVRTLGEDVRPDASGAFVLERILPPGEQAVSVEVLRSGSKSYVERLIAVPATDLFYTGTVDLTFGRRLGDRTTPNGTVLDETYSTGRLAGFVRGRTQGGWTITASADTGENDLGDLFRGFDEKDANDALLRAARENAYPTFGDDSTIVDAAPSDGKFYLRAERNGNHITWGNAQASIAGSKYLRNERTLYGLSGLYRSQGQTSRGQARVSVEGYAASPDRLPGREVFRGTGGSVYFLQREDISVGTATLNVELRDAVTNRVIASRSLVEGVDFDVNYTQGSILLARPLNASLVGGSTVRTPGEEDAVFLTVTYEFTPTAGDLDGLSYGARAEGWIADNLRLGVTGLVEQTDIADQTALGVDLRFELSEQSFIALEHAETEGPGFGASTSSTGGLIVTSTGTAGLAGGTGSATSFEARFDLEEIGLATPGAISAYFEDRSAGFSTLDYEVSDDERLWGLALDAELSATTSVSLSYDDFESDTGEVSRELAATVSLALSETRTLDVGLQYTDKSEIGAPADDVGERTDLAIRYTYAPSDEASVYGFVQGTLDRSGGIEANDRIGLGGSLAFAERWTVEGEVSGGTLGTAAEISLTYQENATDQTYLSYRLDPGRELAGSALRGRDSGTFVAGAKRRVSEQVDMYGETTVDFFGAQRSTTRTYGVEYRPTEALNFSASFENGLVREEGDRFDRNALSLGMSYRDGERLSARAKLEYRVDSGTLSGTVRDQELIFLSAGARMKISEESRLLFGLEYANTDTDGSSVLDGEYGDVTLGYAYRPVLDDKLNVLASYRYLYDMIGQEVDGTEIRGPRQESHVISLDATYDLNQHWTIGGKIGARLSRSSPSEGVAFAQNDAWLGVINARYHFTRKWDALLEARYLDAEQGGFSDLGLLAAGYRHVGENFKVGLGYNFGQFSDDLTDLTYDDDGMFLNLVAKF